MNSSGYALKELSRWGDAHSAFDEVVRLAPASRAATEAREHIRQITGLLTT